MSARSTSALVLFAAVACAAVLYAQATKTITVRVLDGRNGQHIVPDNLIVRINRQASSHVEWVHLADDGTATLKLPANADSFSVHATYDNSTDYYVNCDIGRQRDVAHDTWYPVADVLAGGLVTPSECEKSKSFRDTKIEAKPGEFILLVRKRNWHDRAEDMR